MQRCATYGRENRLDMGDMQPPAHARNPVETRASWRGVLRFTVSDSERKSGLVRSADAADQLDSGPSLCFHVSVFGAQTAPPMAARSPPLHNRDRLYAGYLSERGFVGGQGLWFGPRTALDGRPPVLIEAGGNGRGAPRY